MERLIFRRWRARLWSEARGERILEVGVGTGKNVPYHPPGKSVIGIDFSPAMLEQARRKWPDRDLRLMDVQDLEFPDDSFDVIAASFTFCSVPDPVAGLVEARRVCRPGGRLVLLEHLRTSGAALGALMDFLNPLVVSRSGANINRDTVENVRSAGFRVWREENLWLDIVRLIIAVPEKTRKGRPAAP